LARDGHNIASVVKELGSGADGVDRVVQYLGAIGVPIQKITHRQMGAFETVRFAQRLNDSTTWQFDASSMSDGTMRALGILVSLLSAGRNGQGPTLVGIEEPETALHPAAAGTLVNALLEATAATQVVLTCHSPDLLDHGQVDAEMILVVVNEDGMTRVGPLSPSKKELLSDHLSTAGELLRLDQLTPDPADLEQQKSSECLFRNPG
jgi:predicted ATPase